MPGCISRGRRRRHHHHHHRHLSGHRRMPTWNKQKSSIVGSPLQNSLMKFATAHAGIRHTDILDKCVSPRGLHPVAESVTGHIRRLYDELKGRDKELSREKFERFLHDIQKDQKQPSWVFSHKTTHFTFEEFEQFWWDEYSVAKRPIHRADKDLDKPISNYFISSSHNTYIEDGNQITGEAKALQYKKVLESGCRCVEIDVWNGLEAEETHGLPPSETSRSMKSQTKKHWSFSSMFSWMQDRYRSTQNMSLPTLRSKKSQASFKPKPPTRAKALLHLEDSESTLASMLKREPRVCHAYSTSVGDVSLHESIPFRTVCQTIREAAFSNGNDLPVIISLEVHANPQQQEKMVEIMTDEWAGLLLDEHLPDCDPDTQQPTLRDLKNKILIKVKTGSQVKEGERKSSLSASEPSECASSQQDGKASHGSEAHCQQKETKIPAKKIIHDSLKKLAIYTYSPGHFQSFDLEDAKKPAHIYSFGEEKIKSLHRTEHHGLFQHNRGFLARTFPESLSSFLSSNPNYPTLFWRKGVQMVALNWQVWDTAMELNSAMFDNEDGWVLKPTGYRSSETTSRCQATVAGKKKLDLTITVLAGQHVPTPDMCEPESTTRVNVAAVTSEDFRPRVTCFLHVESAAERDPKKAISKDEIFRRTKSARTEQPDWGSTGSRLHFPAVHHVVEELSFVRFQVEDYRRGWSDRTAWACIRLDRLQEGYRVIKLKTDDGYNGDGLLLVKIEKKLSDELPRVNTWNVCRDGVSRLKSRWSCMS